MTHGIVVVPTYNEAENLAKLLSALLLLPLDLSVLIVDDASPDGTGALADQLAEQHPGRIGVLHGPQKSGLRSSYLRGFRRALELGPELIVQMDADFSHDPAVLPEMERSLLSCDLVLGSRYVPGGSLDKSWPAGRKFLSSFGNLYARTILGCPLRDVTTGYRMWRSEVLQNLPLQRIRSSGYVFQVEMAYLAYLLGYKIAEVPIHFSDRRHGTSKMSLPIQLEAAVRVWDVWWHYRDLRK